MRKLFTVFVYIFYCFLFTSISIHAQNKISKEDIFFAYLFQKGKDAPRSWDFNNYIKAFDFDYYKSISNNEFELKDYSNLVQKKVHNGINRIKSIGSFYFSGTTDIGTYDFQRNAFIYPIKRLIVPEPQHTFSNLTGGDGFHLRLLTVNQYDFSDFILPMSPEKAKVFLSRMPKNRSGQIDRKIYYRIKFKLVTVNDAFDETLSSNFSRYPTYAVTIAIENIEYYEDPSNTKKLVIQYPKSTKIEPITFDENINLKEGISYIYFHNKGFYADLVDDDDVVITYQKIGFPEIVYKERITKLGNNQIKDVIESNYTGGYGFYFLTVNKDVKIRLTKKS